MQTTFLWEVLKEQSIAWVKPDAFFPRFQDEIWVSFMSEAQRERAMDFSCSVRYAERFGVYAEIMNTSHIDAINQGLHYDLVGHFLRLNPGSFLPVFYGVG